MSSQPGVKLIRLPSQADGFMALKSGRAEAFVTAKSTVDAFFEVQDASQFQVNLLERTGEPYAFIASKNKAQMLADIQSALDSMTKDGTLAEMKTKWKLQ